jgi:integrase
VELIQQTAHEVKGKRGHFSPDKQPVNENTESFRNFIRRFKNSPHTKKSYTTSLRRFVKYCNSPDVRKKIGIEIGDNTDLLLFENYNGDKEDRARFIKNLITHYLDHLSEVEGIAPSTLHSYYEAVKHFYVKNEVSLNWDNIKDSIGTPSNIRKNIDMPYTYEEIQKILSKCDERERVIVLLLASTGMRRGAVSELKIGDLKYIEEYGIYEITVYRDFPEEYKTYCSLECAAAINGYLGFRKRYGENITSESYLIRKQFDRQHRSEYLKRVSDNNRVPDRLKTISLPTDPPEMHKVSEWNIQYIIYQLVRDAGIRDHEYKDKKTEKQSAKRYKNMAAHAFRKFFENKCLEAGVDPFFVSVLMGHKSGIGVERHYYRPESINGENSLLELYVKKAMPYLTISDESRLRLKNRELEIRMKQDEERFKRALEERDAKYDGVLNEILRMKRQMGLT